MTADPSLPCSSAFPIQDDEPLVTVVRDVERNPLRANLVDRAEDWPWPTLISGPPPPEQALPLTPPDSLRRGDWTAFVNTPMTEAEVDAIRVSIRRSRPDGDPAWTQPTATHPGLESSLGAPGKPKRLDRKSP